MQPCEYSSNACDLAEFRKCVVELKKGIARGIRPPEDLALHLACVTHKSYVVDLASLENSFDDRDVYLLDDMEVEGHRVICDAIKDCAPDVNLEAVSSHLDEIMRRYLEIGGDTLKRQEQI